MNREDAEEYTQSLGQIVAGSWRQIAWAHRQGVPRALGLTTEEWVEERLGGYIRLNIPARREAVVEMTEDGMSTRQIGEVLGVSHDTVARDLRLPVRNITQTSLEAPKALAPEGSSVRNTTQGRVAEHQPSLLDRPSSNVGIESADEVRKAIARDLPESRGRDRALDVWEPVLRHANEAAREIRDLPEAPQDADELFYVAARDVARLLKEASELVIKRLPDRNQPNLRSVK